MSAKPAGAVHLLRYREPDGSVRLGVADVDDRVFDVPEVDWRVLLDEARWPELDELVTTSAPVAALGEVDLVAPLAPTQLLCVGLNVPGLIGAGVPGLRELPVAAPFWWFKSPYSVAGPGQEIELPDPDQAGRVVPEPELALVVGRPMGPGVASPRGQAVRDYIAGFTICNEVSSLAVEFDKGGDPFAYNLTWSKSYPTFAPIGPTVRLNREFDPSSLAVDMHINGELVVSSSTHHYLWSPWSLVEYFAAVVRMVPGDLIVCGNHPPTRELAHGDVVEVSIEGLGVLRNTAVRTSSPTAYQVPDAAEREAEAYAEALRSRDGQVAPA